MPSNYFGGEIGKMSMPTKLCSSKRSHHVGKLFYLLYVMYAVILGYLILTLTLTLTQGPKVQ